jgi:hypothetical protein
MNKNILEELIKLEKEHLALSATYEENESYEMSFVALWTVLEQIMKPIASIGMQKELRRKLHEWLKHLEHPEVGRKPKEIRSFNTEYSSTTIPTISLIELAIGEVPKLKKLMDSNGKYRKKRNNIAHRAEKLSQKTFTDYKMTVQDAIIELKTLLQPIGKST